MSKWEVSIWISGLTSVRAEFPWLHWGFRCTRIPIVNFNKTLRAAFVPIFFCQTVIREKLWITLSYEKAARKMLMKLRPGPNGEDSWERSAGLNGFLEIWSHEQSTRSPEKQKQIISLENHFNVVFSLE